MDDFKFHFVLNVAVGGGFFADGCVNKYILNLLMKDTSIARYYQINL